MQRLEEMLGLEPVDQIVRQAVVDHHRAEHRGFGLDILRQGYGFGFGRGYECGGHAPLSHPSRRHSRGRRD